MGGSGESEGSQSASSGVSRLPAENCCQMEAVFKHCTKYKAFAVVGPSASCRQSYNIQRAEVKKCNKECDATLCAFRAVFLIFDVFLWFSHSCELCCRSLTYSGPLVVQSAISRCICHPLPAMRSWDIWGRVRSPLCPKGNVCADGHICETISYILVVVVVKYILNVVYCV